MSLDVVLLSHNPINNPTLVGFHLFNLAHNPGDFLPPLILEALYQLLSLTVSRGFTDLNTCS